MAKSQPKAQQINNNLILIGVLLLGLLVGMYMVNTFGPRYSPSAKGKPVVTDPGSSACSQSPDCIVIDLEEEQQSGSYTAATPIEKVIIKAGTRTFTYTESKTDECYSITINGNTVDWLKIGDGPTCQDISHLQIWLGTGTPTTPPDYGN
jgi:hypothetical protein